jgi:tripartite-type tricarboxylate transporter receptor subunit TctC
MRMRFIGDPPERFEAMIKSEVARMGKVIKDAGITVD